MIEIRHLTKKYGENAAVNDLNLTLEPGNIYRFLGPNGAGKTTTMNIITGYIGATSGEVIINGYDINKEPEKAKQCMGYLPELPPVYGDMRVREYLDFVADLKQLDRNTRTADIKQSMDLTKLHSVKDRLIRNLSKGYRQRVGLAQALMGMPEIIILDEPTVGLDPKQIIEIRNLILSLKEKHTVILSSHILQEISAVCDHVFIISKGNLVASDTMENLEETMSGAQQLTVTLRTTEELAQSLLSLPGVKTADVLEV
ncbi:MAG: ABC transporter ATP-binding protein, partial [Lachnospiraceae bacterium]|nr:ABC transporter ATP-binding protein [Lachnospiraceae bacterium]